MPNGRRGACRLLGGRPSVGKARQGWGVLGSFCKSSGQWPGRRKTRAGAGVLGSVCILGQCGRWVRFVKRVRGVDWVRFAKWGASRTLTRRLRRHPLSHAGEGGLLGSFCETGLWWLARVGNARRPGARGSVEARPRVPPGRALILGLRRRLIGRTDGRTEPQRTKARDASQAIEWPDTSWLVAGGHCVAGDPGFPRADRTAKPWATEQSDRRRRLDQTRPGASVPHHKAPTARGRACPHPTHRTRVLSWNEPGTIWHSGKSLWLV
jgi:hypothetical protein